MGRRAWAILPVIGVLVVGVILPGLALAGKKVVSGQQTLQIKARLRPASAGARHVAFDFRFDYRSTTPGQQPPYNVKTITLVMPRGLVLNPAAAPACKRSQIDSANGDLSTCPLNTIVGHGSVVANAAPTISTAITGTVTVYNAVNDVGRGQPKGTRNLVLWVKTSIGVNSAIAFRVLKGAGGRVELRATFPKPSQPGVSPGSFTIQTVLLSVFGSGKRSYITDPAVCPGSWPFSLRVVNYFDQPSITARDQVKCRR
jgi:hypothetical protein